MTQSMPKRVMYISPVGAAGGGERVLMELACGMRRYGSDTAVACLRPGAWAEGLWGNDVPISFFAPGYRLRQPLKLARAVAWLRSQLRSFQPDVIHVNHAAWPWARLASIGMRTKRVWHLHDYPDHMDFPTRLGVRMAPDGVIFTTRHVASGFERLITGAQAIIAPVTLDPTAVRSAAVDDTLLKTHGLSTGQYLLSVSRWQRHKRLGLIPRIIHAYQADSESHKIPLWVVVGAAKTPAEREVRAQFLEEARELSVDDRVLLLEGCSDSQLRSLYKNANRLVHLADSEGFGLVLLESMSSGVPFIAADAAGPKEIAKNYGAGKLVAKGSIEAFVEALRTIGDVAARRRQVDLAERACEQFSSTQMVEATRDFYRSVLSLD